MTRRLLFAIIAGIVVFAGAAFVVRARRPITVPSEPRSEVPFQPVPPMGDPMPIVRPPMGADSTTPVVHPAT